MRHRRPGLGRRTATVRVLNTVGFGDAGLLPPTDGSLRMYWRQRLIEDAATEIPLIPRVLGVEGLVVRAAQYLLPTLRQWHSGRVCLVGDAAHGLPSYSGQGASMGREDALTLARCLRDLPDHEAAFSACARMRLPRLAAAAAASGRNGRLRQPGNPIPRGLRDLIMPIAVRRSVQGTFALTRFHGDWDERVTVASSR